MSFSPFRLVGSALLLLLPALAACDDGPTNALDRQAPTVQIEETTVVDSTAQVLVRAEDDVAVDRFTYTLNGGPEQAANAERMDAETFRISIPDLDVGATLITVIAYDESGNASSTSTQVTRRAPDTAGPSLALHAPEPGVQIDTTAVTLRGSVSDDRALERVQYHVGESAATEIELENHRATQFTVSVSGLEPGENPLVVTARDSAGNETVDSALVRVDLEAPSLSLDAPDSGLAVDSGAVRLSGTSTDRGGIARIHFRLNEGDPVVIASQEGDSATFDTAVSRLEAGENRLTVVSRDSAGNEDALERTVILDTRSPSLSLNGVGETLSLDTTHTVIEGQAEDQGEAGLDRVAYAVDGGSESSAELNDDGTFSFSLEKLPAGSTTLRVAAYDRAGNVAQSHHTLRVDQDRPTLTIDEPAPGALRGSADIRLRGSASDPASVEELAWRLNNGSFQQLSISPDTLIEFDTEVEGLEPGENRLLIRAEDGVGNRRSDTLTVVRDTASPELTLSQPDPGTSVSSSSVTVAGSAQDDRQLDRVTVEVNGGGEVVIAEGDGPTVSLEHTVENLEAGENLLVFRAVDAAGNETTTERTVTLDADAPDVTGVDAPAGESVTGAEVSVTVSVGDADDVDRITYEINGSGENQVDLGGQGSLEAGETSGTAASSTAASSSGSFTFSVGPLDEGENQIVLRVYDAVGNTARSSFAVTREGADPTVSITDPSDGASLSSQSATVKGSASDDHEVSRIRYKVNDRAPTTLSTPGTPSADFEFDVSLDPGQNDITVTASDRAGQESTASIQVTAPTPTNNPPTLTLTSPADSSTVMSSTVTVEGVATDDSRVDQVEYRVNSGALQSVSITPSDTVDLSFSVSLDPGANTVEVVASDGAGQSATSTRTVFFAQKPSAGFSTGGSTQAGQATTFDATASSDPLGLPLVFSWEFGDGTRGGSSTVSHTYSSGGTFSTRLIVSNSFKADTATRSLSISAPPAPTATNGIVNGLVKDASGNDLSGVSVAQVDGSLSGTTGSDGRVTLSGVPVGVPVVFELSKAGFVSKRVRVRITSSGGSTSFDARILDRATPVTISDVEDGGSATGTDGAAVELSPGSMVDGSGDPVTGDVDVSLTPVDVSGSEIDAFPGDFSGVDSQGNTGGLQSFGVADFSLTQGGQELDVAPGETATINIPIYTGGASLGQSIDLWSLDEESGRWIQEGTGTVVSSSGSPTGLALEATVTHFSAWNADFLYPIWEVDLECLDRLGNSVTCTVKSVTADASGPRTTVWSYVPKGGKVDSLPPDEKMDVQARIDGDVLATKTITTGPAGGRGSLEFRVNRRPTADFTFSPSEPAPGQSVSFDASGSDDPDGSIAEYRWDFDDDGTVDATTSSATTSHTFTSSGSHFVTLTVVDDGGATDTSTDGLEVNGAPNASFTSSPADPVAGSSVSFDASGSSDSDGSIVEYRWDFDDDGTVDLARVSPTANHIFSAAGSHPVTLTVVDDDGATASTVRTVDVNGAPNASFTFSPIDVVVNQSVSFDASGSSDPDGSIVEYRWDFDDDGITDETNSGPTTSHTFTTADGHAVTLTVVDDRGATTSKTNIVSVGANDAPTASFTFSPSDPAPGETITFDGSASSDPDGSIVEYRWNFTGDATPEVVSSSPTATHTYSTSAAHLATLTVVDDDGVTDMTGRTINVNQGPSATFSFTPSNPSVGQSVSFDASGSSDSDGVISEYRWDFDGDGTVDLTSSSASANHTFSSSGSRSVTLTVVDNDGATTSTTNTVTVGTNQTPTASFTFSPSSPSAGDAITFDASGSSDPDGSIAEYGWDFDRDGTLDVTTSDPTTTHTFPTRGEYLVTLVVVDNAGATDGTSEIVVVSP